MKIKFSFMAPMQWGKIRNELYDSVVSGVAKYRRSPKSDTKYPPVKNKAKNDK